MTDILLSHGYVIEQDAAERRVMKPYPALGMLYVSSHLRARGCDVDVFDSTFASVDAFEAHVRATRPARVGLYATLMTKRTVLRMAAIARDAGAQVIAGGPDPASYAEEYLDHGVDVVVVGEGEVTCEELIAGRDLGTVDGIVFRDGDGRVVRTAPRAAIADLGGQPWPDREAIDVDRYLEAWRGRHGETSLSLITARGCPYTCRWCSHTVFGHTHRRRPVEDVADEVEWLVERYGPDQLWYADDVLTIHRGWFLKYAAELERRGVRVPFECISRADRLHDDVVDALEAMGCARLWIGAESGSQRILDRMDRRTDAADIRAKTHALQARGIEVGMFIMLGYEGEELADIEATAEHLKAAGPDRFLTTVAYPIKGTPFHDEVSERVYSNIEDWADRTDRDLGIAGRHSRAFYAAANRWLVNDVEHHRLVRTRSRDVPALMRTRVSAALGRRQMMRTIDERETAPAGTGWSPAARAEHGW